MDQQEVRAIILGAGKGTRMKSRLPKVLHRAGGRTLIAHVLAAVEALEKTSPVVVIGPDMLDVAQAVALHPTVIQQPPLGTAHAVLAARDYLNNFDGIVLILFADTPLIRPETVREMAHTLRQEQAAVVVLSLTPEDPADYGRIILNSQGEIERIVEYRDATPKEREILLCNSGVMALDGRYALELLGGITNENAKGEYYLTDVVGRARAQNLKCVEVPGACNEVLGVNTKGDLARVEALLQQRWRQEMLDRGVTLIDPHSVYFSFDTEIAGGVTIEPHVFFGPGVMIEEGVHIKAFSHLEDAHIGRDCVVGPFARLRPGTKLEAQVKVGNFVEIKASYLEADAKVSHLSYIGDAHIGAGANVGAGVITCNYDGYFKHKTTIGAGAFIGSNSALVAPVTIGNGAIVGAGSAITQDVMPNDLVLERSEQQRIHQGATKYRQKRGQLR